MIAYKYLLPDGRKLTSLNRRDVEWVPGRWVRARSAGFVAFDNGKGFTATQPGCSVYGIHCQQRPLLRDCRTYARLCVMEVKGHMGVTMGGVPCYRWVRLLHAYTGNME